MTAFLAPPTWTIDAVCANNPTDPLTGRRLTHDDFDTGTDAARRACATCPVRLNCANEALDNAIAHCMWGGLTEADRRRIAAGAYGHQGIERPGAARHGTRARYVAGCDDSCGGACREAHRRWAAERRAIDAWTRKPTTATDGRAGRATSEHTPPGIPTGHLVIDPTDVPDWNADTWAPIPPDADFDPNQHRLPHQNPRHAWAAPPQQASA